MFHGDKAHHVHTTRDAHFVSLHFFFSGEIIEKRHFAITVMIKNDSSRSKITSLLCCGWFWRDKSWLEFLSIFALFYCSAFYSNVSQIIRRFPSVAMNLCLKFWICKMLAWNSVELSFCVKIIIVAASFYVCVVVLEVYACASDANYTT